ncbi:MAG: CRP-like cAMP-binding protein [Patiriisocius sp.]|jgi:CRP-like cAMP-binding protein
MIELLFKKLEVNENLSTRSKDLLREHIVLRHIKPGALFLEKGNFSNEIAFVFNGVFRSYLYHKVNEETTIEFINENGCLSNMKSFYGNIKSEYAIECEVTSDLAIITREAWGVFEKEIPEWRNTINHIHNRYLLETHNFQGEILNQEALTSYRCFCEKFPNIVHNIPLSHIASFLGITQSTLSRIRKKNFDR